MSIMVEHNKFFKGLAAVLSIFEQDVTYLRSDVLVPIAEEFTTDECAVRTYSIYVDEDLVISVPSVLPKNKIGCLESKTYFSLDETRLLTQSLFSKYPYLELIMNKVRNDVLYTNVSDDIDIKMVDAAIGYTSYCCDLEKAAVYIKKQV